MGNGSLITLDFPGHVVIYIWIFFAVFTITGAAFGIRWAKQAGQFDESIKYQLFTEIDDDMYRVVAEQAEADRQEALAEKQAKKAKKEVGTTPVGGNRA